MENPDKIFDNSVRFLKNNLSDKNFLKESPVDSDFKEYIFPLSRLDYEISKLLQETDFYDEEEESTTSYKFSLEKNKHIWGINEEDSSLFADISKKQEPSKWGYNSKGEICIDINTSTTSTQPDFYHKSITPTSQNFTFSPRELNFSSFKPKNDCAYFLKKDSCETADSEGSQINVYDNSICKNLTPITKDSVNRNVFNPNYPYEEKNTFYNSSTMNTKFPTFYPNYLHTELTQRKLILPVNSESLTNRSCKAGNLRAKEGFDCSQFYIDMDKIIKGDDKRTTLMIKNIPNKYSISILREEINSYYEGIYDFLYLPLDPSNNCNLGFAFINLLDSFQILQFVEIFKGKSWKKFNSLKRCEISYAKFQGKKELNSQYEKTSSEGNDDKKPFVMNYENYINNIEVPIKYLEKFKVLYPKLVYKIVSKGAYFSFNSILERDNGYN